MNPSEVESVFAEDGVANGLTKGKLVIDMSSISPLETQAFAKKINALGCDYLDAPVSGGEVGAREATLTIMVMRMAMVGLRVTCFSKVSILQIRRFGDGIFFPLASTRGGHPQC